MTKVDYDPRSGGFGYLPLLVVLLLVALLLAQAVWLRRRRRAGNASLVRGGGWRAQGVIVVLALIILLVQPATFDARYVIGPTILLLTALLLTTLTVTAPLVFEVVAGVLALLAVVGQVAWTEKMVFPGLSDIRLLRALPESAQPITPGGVWGRGEPISWLPDDEGCYDIALQTSGGLSEAGMRESALLSTLPYGLYGPSLCNDVEPIQIESYESTGFRFADPIPTADYLVLYQDDLARWRRLVPDSADCWVRVQEIDGNENYPTAVDVLRNECR
ncbi:hypothetical protein [Naasia aerilata]|uniref:Uncharacterized protein n=1 Tax=Naasia aerilata TaxID=1162966 RepID=A0ABM8GCC5_9MICO|nr:hypothetical protein [Naasia aerilata]BDZ45895.1 hypothetical protein GCM10025866_18040 [Naasia aerilata]